MQTNNEVFAKGRLVVKTQKNNSPNSFPAGLHRLGINSKRDGLIYIPSAYDPNKPSPLAVMLHGAGGDAEHGVSLIKHLADEANIILLAPISKSGSWDIISSNQFGPDIAFINQVLTDTFSRYNIDAGRMAVGGFSDGASYALSVGLTNGDLFSHIIAFSPGFFYSIQTKGKPHLFISHGTSDEVLPIVSCSRRIVPRLQKQGYEVMYHEFDGPHIVPAHISLEAVRWFLK